RVALVDRPCVGSGEVRRGCREGNGAYRVVRLVVCERRNQRCRGCGASGLSGDRYSVAYCLRIFETRERIDLIRAARRVPRYNDRRCIKRYSGCRDDGPAVDLQLYAVTTPCNRVTRGPGRWNDREIGSEGCFLLRRYVHSVRVGYTIGCGGCKRYASRASRKGGAGDDKIHVRVRGFGQC